MALEALSSNELLNFIIYDTISTAQYMSCNDNSSETHFLFDNSLMKTHQEQQQQQQQQKQNLVVVDTCCSNSSSSSMKQRCLINSVGPTENPVQRQNLAAAAVQGRKKRRRRQRVCKNKEEAETQRMTHIAVERNRRKQMNEHLAVLRSLMPESYVQRGDQASIVGGAIEFVKELEHHLQSLEAHKFTLLQHGNEEAANDKFVPPITSTPFAQFFSYPQYTCSSQFSNKYTSKSKAAVADIEVTLIETHANLRILSRRRLRQVSKMVTGLQTVYLTILHLNVTTLDPLVLYSISAKVEEGCVLNSADDIAAAVHHILRIIEEEATLCGQDSSLGLPRTC